VTAIDRAQWLADARALLDLIEANPDLPVGGFRIAAYANTGNDDTDREFVDATAEVLGTEPETSPYGRHYQAHVTIGHAMYEVTAIPSAAMRRYSDVQRLGKAALDAAEQAVSA
jgi:hypothetical protein